MSNLVFCLTQVGAILDKSKNNINVIQQRLLRKKFTINTMIRGGKFKYYISKYENTKRFIILPRFNMIKLSKDKKFIKKLGCPIKIINNIKLNNKINKLSRYNNLINLTPNQNIVLNHIIKNIYNKNNISFGNAGLILQLEAGQGKSYIAMKLIKKLSYKTLIIVHNISLLQQWKELLLKHFPNIEIGTIYGKSKRDGLITVGVINSLLKAEYEFENNIITNVDYLKDFDFIIFDECHLYCSKMVSKIFNLCQRTFMLGLSATPYRENDKFEPVSYWNIGSIVDVSKLDGFNIKLNSIQGRVQCIKYYGSDELTKHIINNKTQMISIPKMLEQLSLDNNRKNLIVNKAFELLEKGHHIFIFADRRNYLLDLKNKLIDKHSKNLDKNNIIILDENNDDMFNNLVNNDHNIFDLMGGSSQEKVKMVEKIGKIILTTYQYLGTGKSIPKMTAIILATPRKTRSQQFINRIFRLGYRENFVRDIVDIVDWKTCLKNQWYSRKKYYKEKKFNIIEIKINYDNLDLK